MHVRRVMNKMHVRRAMNACQKSYELKKYIKQPNIQAVVYLLVQYTFVSGAEGAGSAEAASTDWLGWCSTSPAGDGVSAQFVDNTQRGLQQISKHMN